MKIIPMEGYVLVSNQELVDEKKQGLILLPTEEKKRTYLRTESAGKAFDKGEFVFAQPFKTKMQIEDNLFLIAEEDIVATFTLEENEQT